MTIATNITVLRILLIPVFVCLAIYYGESVKRGEPDELWRWLAVGTFLFAAISDALDGWVARRFNQQTALGKALDPIADKGLLIAAIITLSLTNWGQYLPIWFAVLVITRDALLIGGILLIKHLAGRIDLWTHWTGKTATAAQMVAVLWLMFGFSKPPLAVPVAIAGFFTLVTVILYLREGLRQLHAHTHAPSEAPSDPDERKSQ